MIKRAHRIIFSGIVVTTMGVAYVLMSAPILQPLQPTEQPPALPTSTPATQADSESTTLATTSQRHTATQQTTDSSVAVSRPQIADQPVTVQPHSTTPTFTTSDGTTFPLRTYKALGTANDPDANQWWTTNTGLDAAWTIGAGSRPTVVAVIDTGFGLQHEELATRWAMNAGEQGPATSEAASQLNCTDRSLPLDQSCNLIDDDYDGVVDNELGTTAHENPSRYNCSHQQVALGKACNLIDDDANGYIDDVTGWDFRHFDNNVRAGSTNTTGTYVQHGTEVSGVLAATGNNNTGIAGVNWATQILPLQAIDDDGYGNTLTVARAIYYAADRGVDVINLSLGSAAPDTYLRQAVQYAIDSGIVVVASSGNDGCECMSYPARYPEVVAVGAANTSGDPASFSSYGANLDMLAPGVNIMTTGWTAHNPTSSYVGSVAGTSFAAPYVSGLLSLARSHHPTATWQELIHTVRASANHTGVTTTQPVSAKRGSGYVQADQLLQRLTTPATPHMRYQFSPMPATGTLASQRAHQCRESGDFPATMVYEIGTGSASYYTLDTLDFVRAQGRGDAAKKLWYTCVGLPGDQPDTLRLINLFSEIKNDPTHKWVP